MNKCDSLPELEEMITEVKCRLQLADGNHQLLSQELDSIDGKDFRLYSPLSIPVRGHGGCSRVNKETSLVLKSGLWSEGFTTTSIDLSGIGTHDSLRANQAL